MDIASENREKDKLRTKVKMKYTFLDEFEKKIELAQEINTRRTKVERALGKEHTQIFKKLGEEVVEMIISSQEKLGNDFIEESADVLFYYLLALHTKGYKLKDVLKVLNKRFKHEDSKLK